MIFHFSISLRSSAIDFPVFFEITWSGLKPTLISCNKSPPVNFPAERTCPKTKESELSLFASHIEISPSIRSDGIIFSVSIPKASIVLVACANHLLSNGVVAASFWSCKKISFPFSAEPVNVFMEVRRFCISEAVLTAYAPSAVTPATAIPLATCKLSSPSRFLSMLDFKPAKFHSIFCIPFVASSLSFMIISCKFELIKNFQKILF